MKKLLLPLFVVISLLNGCNFSKGVHKDLATGLSYSYDGLSVEKIYLTKNEQEKITKAEAEKFSYLFIHVEGMSMFTEKDGKIHIGASMAITDEKGTELLRYENLFAENGAFAPTNNIIKLHAYLGTGFKVGQKFYLKSKIWDKEDPEKVINIETSFRVVEPKYRARIQIKAQNITYDDVVILDNENNSVGNMLEKNKRYYLVIGRPKGFEQANNRISITEKYTLEDSQGNILAQGEAMAQNTEGQEIASEEDADPYFFPFTLKDEVEGSSFLLNVLLADNNNPENILQCSAELIFQ